MQLAGGNEGTGHMGCIEYNNVIYQILRGAKQVQVQTLSWACAEKRMEVADEAFC